MSNKKRQTHYNTNHHKNKLHLAAASEGVRTSARLVEGTTAASSLAAAANQIMTNTINVTIAYDANAEMNNLNKSMILTVSLVNPQD
jgi:hypothetical protein